MWQPLHWTAKDYSRQIMQFDCFLITVIEFPFHLFQWINSSNGIVRKQTPAPIFSFSWFICYWSVRMAIGSRNVFSAVYSFVCLVVCFYQIFSVFQTYTEYEVTSHLGLKIPDPLPVPDLTICVRYTDIIDLEQLGLKNNRSLTRGYTVPAIREIQEISTVADVLKMTPREDALLGECMFRKPDKYFTETEYGDLCMKYFTAKSLLLKNLYVTSCQLHSKLFSITEH